MKETIDSRQLRAFVMLAHAGSFTDAARQLYLSQSAVSHSMKALEQSIGCRLLDRVGKRVILTQAGEQLLHHAEKILAEMQAARTSLEVLGKWGRPRLRLGASSTACQYILPSVLRKLKDEFPQCLLSIVPEDTSAAVESLRANRVDLALMVLPNRDAQLELHPLFTDELVFVTDPAHAWAQARKVNRADVARQNYILYNKASYTFALVQEYFRQEEMELNTVIEVGNMAATKELVKLGLGVGILPLWIVQNEIAEKTLVALPLGKRKLRRTWVIAHRQGRRLSLPEEKFLSLCRTAGESISATSLSLKD
jgi:DNA-binding transcriptional LysR family regulator